MLFRKKLVVAFITLISLVLLHEATIASAVVLQPFGGGTGISTSTSVGQCLQVLQGSTTSSLTYTFAACSGGSGSGSFNATGTAQGLLIFTGINTGTSSANLTFSTSSGLLASASATFSGPVTIGSSTTASNALRVVGGGTGILLYNPVTSGAQITIQGSDRQGSIKNSSIGNGLTVNPLPLTLSGNFNTANGFLRFDDNNDINTYLVMGVDSGNNVFLQDAVSNLIFLSSTYAGVNNLSIGTAATSGIAVLNVVGTSTLNGNISSTIQNALLVASSSGLFTSYGGSTTSGGGNCLTAATLSATGTLTSTNGTCSGGGGASAATTTITVSTTSLQLATFIFTTSTQAGVFTITASGTTGFTWIIPPKNDQYFAPSSTIVVGAITTSTWVVNASGSNITTSNNGGSSTVGFVMNPTFQNLTLNTPTNSILWTASSGLISAATIGSGLTISSGTLTSAPSTTIPTNDNQLTNGSGYITTSTWVINASGTNIQAINSGGSSTIGFSVNPTFTNVTLTNLSSTNITASGYIQVTSNALYDANGNKYTTSTAAAQGTLTTSSPWAANALTYTITANGTALNASSSLTVIPTSTYGGLELIVGSSTDFADSFGPHSLSIISKDNVNSLTLSDASSAAQFGFYINSGQDFQVQMGSLTNSKYGIFTNNGSPQVGFLANGNVGIGKNINSANIFSPLTIISNPAQSTTSTLVLMGSNFITGGSPSGTSLGSNPASGYNGDFVNFEVNSSTQFKISATGTVQVIGGLIDANGNKFVTSTTAGSGTLTTSTPYVANALLYTTTATGNTVNSTSGLSILSDGTLSSTAQRITSGTIGTIFDFQGNKYSTSTGVTTSSPTTATSFAYFKNGNTIQGITGTEVVNGPGDTNWAGADDGARLNSALANATSGMTIYVAQGNYTASTQIVIPTSTQNLQLICLGTVGASSTSNQVESNCNYKWTGATGATMFYSDKMNSSIVRGFTFNGNNKANICMSLISLDNSEISWNGCTNIQGTSTAYGFYLSEDTSTFAFDNGNVFYQDYVDVSAQPTSTAWWIDGVGTTSTPYWYGKNTFISVTGIASGTGDGFHIANGDHNIFQQVVTASNGPGYGIHLTCSTVNGRCAYGNEFDMIGNFLGASAFGVLQDGTNGSGTYVSTDNFFRGWSINDNEPIPSTSTIQRGSARIEVSDSVNDVNNGVWTYKSNGTSLSTLSQFCPLNGVCQFSIGIAITGSTVTSTISNVSSTNITASGYIQVTGNNLFDANGNKYSTSTSAGGGVTTSSPIFQNGIPFFVGANASSVVQTNANLTYVSSTGVLAAPTGTVSGILAVGTTTIPAASVFSVTTPSGTEALSVTNVSTSSIIWAAAASSTTDTSVLSGANTYAYITSTSIRFSQANVGFTTSSVTVAACGTNPSVVGSNNTGVITLGTGGITQCTLDFAVATSAIGTPWINTPVPIVNDSSSTDAVEVTAISSSSATFTFPLNIIAGSIYYWMIGNPN